MKKYNLVISEKHFNSFHSKYFTNTFTEYFDVSFIERIDKMDSKNCFLVADCMEVITNGKTWCDYLKDQGYLTFVDSLWCMGDHAGINEYNVSNRNWFWYYESLTYRDMGYNDYRPNKTYKKMGLMPMGLIKPHFEMLYERMIPYLDDFYYSYVERLGKYLPEDAGPLFPASAGVTGQQQRYFNPMWYNDTYFSLVAETTKDLLGGTHVTEKSFKPMAYYHPFIVWGQPGTLHFLKDLGFETFENLFDESYDLIQNDQDRLSAVINNVKSFQKHKYDSLTLEKLAHNHNLFFNEGIVKERILKEIIHPMLEWIESKR